MKDFLWQIESIRKRVLSLIRLLSGKDNVLRGFENHHCTTMSSDQDILIYINDVQDHIAAMLSNLHQFEGLLSRSKTNYLAQLEAATLTEKFRVFKFLSRMAVLSLILTLITLTSNLFGVNVGANTAMFSGTSTVAWFSIVSLEIVLAVVLFLVARRYSIWW
jgi:magnesium transporter